jgi:aspartyl-tRNA(Asn)/glutamyl-tRNA(Gln) amidotransferase subunit A
MTMPKEGVHPPVTMDQCHNVFRELFEPQAVESGLPLSGYRVSIKDTFDVKGYTTCGGSRLLGKVPAEEDADAVARLRSAGALLLGHTNMTELAYSGLGLNPHFGTPDNPLKPGHVPGGSTSGGAVSVAMGIADIALGTDTGGSLRTPAAFCGVTGFKPSQGSVSRTGCLPLSDSLDSVGPIAKTVADCQKAWEVISGVIAAPFQRTYRVVIPTNFGLDDLDSEVQAGFDHAVAKIRAAGIEIEERVVPILETYKTLPVWQFSAVESHRYYQNFFDLNDEQLDPRVASRVARAQETNEEAFAQTKELREAWIKNFADQEPDTILLMPTVAITPPTFEALKEDSEYNRINLLCLRNTSLGNVLNGCSLSLPFKTPKQEPMGVMLTAQNGHDAELLSLGAQLEAALA